MDPKEDEEEEKILIENEWLDYIKHVSTSSNILHISSFSPSGSLLNYDLARSKRCTLYASIKKNINLVSLDLEEIGIEQKGAKIIADVIKTSSTLTRLDLGDNKIKKNGARAIARAIPYSSTLQYLNLSRNLIPEEGMIRILESVEQNTILDHLDLHDNENDNWWVKVPCESIFRVVERNKRLRYLDLGGCVYKLKDLRKIGDALIVNTSLTYLGLSGRNEPNGWEVFGEVLRKNSTLLSLDLSDNSIPDSAGKAIGEGLEENSTLTSLILSWNQLSKASDEAFGKAIRRNTSLKHLDLSMNGEDFLGTKVAEGLQVNEGLLYIKADISGDKLAGDLQDREIAFREAIEKNATLIGLYLNIEYSHAFLNSVAKNSHLIDLKVAEWGGGGGWIGDFHLHECCARVEKVMMRNLGFWKRRFEWSCVVLFYTRVILMRQETMLPNEILHQIISFLVPQGILTGRDLRRVICFGCDDRTLGRDKMNFFVKGVFGEKDEKKGKEIVEKLKAYSNHVK